LADPTAYDIYVEVRQTPEGGDKPQRHTGRKGYYIVRDPHGRYAKVKQENLDKYIPKHWGRGVGFLGYYDGFGNLNERTHCFLEITSRKHAEWFESPRNMNLGLIFGRWQKKK
jgi:hypothetical protein